MKLLITLTTLLAVGLFSTLSAHATEDLKTPAPEMVSLLNGAPGITVELDASASALHVSGYRIPAAGSTEVLTLSHPLTVSPSAQCRQCHDTHFSAGNYHENHRHRLCNNQSTGLLNTQHFSPSEFTLSRILSPSARGSA